VTSRPRSVIMGGGYGERSDWQFSHEYADAHRPGTLVSETLILRESGLCRWSRLLNTADVKGVRGQGECWHRGSVKSICFAAKVGDPSREFSLTGERQEVRRRAMLMWVWAKAPVLTGFLCLICNPLTIMLLISGFIPLALYYVYPKDDARYLMSEPAHAEGFAVATVCAFFVALAGIACSWWLHLVGKPPEPHEPQLPSDFRPRFKAVDRLYGQNSVNGAVVGLVIVWCSFMVVCCPFLSMAGRKSEFCNLDGCMDELGNVVGTCGVGSCNCGLGNDLSCTVASSLDASTSCRSVDAPICSPVGDVESGAHLWLLVLSFGSVCATGVLMLLWLVNHLTIALTWNEALHQTASAVKPKPTAYHRIAITFEAEQQGTLVCTVSGDQDLNVLASLLMPEAPTSSDFSGLDFVPSYAPPAIMDLPMDSFAGFSQWPSDLEDLAGWEGDELEISNDVMAAPPDLQWD